MAVRTSEWQDNQTFGSTISGSLENDRNPMVSIGIDYPFHKSDGADGWFETTLGCSADVFVKRFRKAKKSIRN